jgi:hypothetical protein
MTRPNSSTPCAAAGWPAASGDRRAAGDYATDFATRGRRPQRGEIAEAPGDPMRPPANCAQRASAGAEPRPPISSQAVRPLPPWSTSSLLPLGRVCAVCALAGLADARPLLRDCTAQNCSAGTTGFANYLTRVFGGVGLLGLGIGGGALLLMMIDYVVRLLGKFARLHYELLNRADSSAAAKNSVA